MLNGWYGWANDGKGTLFDYLALMKARYDGWKFCMFKPEDLGSYRSNKKIVVTANDIYNNLVWTYTGITPYKHFAEKYKMPQLKQDEYIDAIEFVEKHFIIINPKDVSHKNILETFTFYYEKYGIDVFLIDPFRCIHIVSDAKQTDERMNHLFYDCKYFSLETNTSFNFIAHPKSMRDVRVSNKPGSPFKLVTQEMISGGAAWDNAMDGEYSIYRPERHLLSSNPKVHFHNLKQRKAELVGANRGHYEHIEFDFKTKRYYFDRVCPITGQLKEDKFAAAPQGNIFDYVKGQGKGDTPKVNKKGFPTTWDID
jgi:twinkle protein